MQVAGEILGRIWQLSGLGRQLSNAVLCPNDRYSTHSRRSQSGKIVTGFSQHPKFPVASGHNRAGPPLVTVCFNWLLDCRLAFTL